MNSKYFSFVMPLCVLLFFWMLFTVVDYICNMNDFNRVPSFKETQVNLIRFFTGQPSIWLDQ